MDPDTPQPPGEAKPVRSTSPSLVQRSLHDDHGAFCRATQRLPSPGRHARAVVARAPPWGVFLFEGRAAWRVFLTTRIHQPALNKLIEASRRVAHDKHAWSKAANVAARAAALESEKLTKRAEKAEKEAEDLRVQVTALKAALEAEKQRAAKQQALSNAAVQAANKRAAQFEQLYEHAKAAAVDERNKVESFRVAAVELNRQLEYAGPAGAIPLNLLMTATDAGIRSARRSMGTGAAATPSPGAAGTPRRVSTARATGSRGVSAGTPSPSGAAGKGPSPSVSSASKVTANLASKAAAGTSSSSGAASKLQAGGGKGSTATSSKKGNASSLSALLNKAPSPRTSAVTVPDAPAGGDQGGAAPVAAA